MNPTRAFGAPLCRGFFAFAESHCIVEFDRKPGAGGLCPPLAALHFLSERNLVLRSLQKHTLTALGLVLALCSVIQYWTFLKVWGFSVIDVVFIILALVLSFGCWYSVGDREKRRGTIRARVASALVILAFAWLIAWLIPVAVLGLLNRHLRIFHLVDALGPVVLAGLLLAAQRLFGEAAQVQSATKGERCS